MYNLPTNNNNNSNNNSKFFDFNAKPKGWSQFDNQPQRNYQDLDFAIKALSESIDKQHFDKSPTPVNRQQAVSPPLAPAKPPAQSPTKFEMNPNKLDINAAWNQQQQQQRNESMRAAQAMSKEGVQTIKEKLFESTQPQPTVSNRTVKLSSHENYLFNNKNSQQNTMKMLNELNNQFNSANNSNNNNSYAQRNLNQYNNPMIASSDL